MTSKRDALASVFLFAWIAAIYLVFGVQGLGHALMGMACTYVTIGIATGYWIGKGNDWYVIELMKWIRTNSKAAAERNEEYLRRFQQQPHQRSDQQP